MVIQKLANPKSIRADRKRHSAHRGSGKAPPFWRRFEAYGNGPGSSPQRKTSLATGFLLLCLITLACWSQAVQARASLSGIDAKLDALLAAQAIDLDKRVELVSVTSLNTICSRDRAYHRIYPDGSQDATEFVVPAGHTLVILEITWRAFVNPNTAFRGDASVRMTLSSSPPDVFQSSIFYYSPPFQMSPDNTLTRPGTSETLIMGTAVGEGRVICAGVASATQTFGAAHTIETSTLRGILVPNN